MANTGRTVRHYTRVFIDQYDGFNNDFTKVGTMGVEWDSPIEPALADAVKAIKAGLGQATVVGPALNSYLNMNGTTGIHDLLAALTAGGTKRILSVLFGVRAVPAQGDWCFSFPLEQEAYTTDSLPGSGYVACVIPTVKVSNLSSPLMEKCFGVVLDPGSVAKTDVNAAGGVDNAASSARGGHAFLHLIASNGTCTFKVQHSTNDTDWADLVEFVADGSGLLGEMKATAAITTTVNRYLRWQIVLDTATSVKFVMTFVRG